MWKILDGDDDGYIGFRTLIFKIWFSVWILELILVVGLINHALLFNARTMAVKIPILSTSIYGQIFNSLNPICWNFFCLGFSYFFFRTFEIFENVSYQEITVNIITYAELCGNYFCTQWCSNHIAHKYQYWISILSTFNYVLQ